MNYFTIFLLCLTTPAIVRCDEHPIELSASADIKKLSAPTVTKVEESGPESKAKDGDTLDAMPSNQNSQQYNYVVSKPSSPIQIDLGPYDSAGGQQQTHGPQYETQSQIGQQSPLTLYRPIDIGYSTGAGASGESAGAVDSAQQQIRNSYGNQAEQLPLYSQKTYIRQAQLDDNGPNVGSGANVGSGYRVPELPLSQPGISSTYTSPDVKIVSHTRSFLPVVYKKEQNDNAQTQPTSAEQEYDKAVQDRPGGSYAQEQQESYESEGQRPDSQRPNSQQESYGSAGSGPYRGEEDRDREQHRNNDDDVVRGPYYNIHKPFAAHVQVIEEKDDYRNAQKEGFGGQSYGLRTQPKPQYKNYRPSGYTPGMLNAYSPPSPPLASLLPPLGQGYRQTSAEQTDDDDDDDNNYSSQEQNGGRNENGPEPQGLQQQAQSPQDYKQTPYGVEVEFDQAKSQANVLRGPGGPYDGRRPDQYNGGSSSEDQSDDQRGAENQDYSREQERPNYSSDNSNENSYENNGNRGQDYDSPNQLGPKYNVDNENGRGPEGYQRGVQHQNQQQLIKPQEIEYGFIPLSEMNMKNTGGYGEPTDFRGPPNRGRPNGPEGYREQRGFGGPNGGPHMQRRPQQPFNNGPEYNSEEEMGVMYGRGQGNEGQRGNGYEGNDVYREQQMSGPAPHGLNGYRKPAFDRPMFMKNGAPDHSGFMGGYNGEGGGAGGKGDSEEEMDSDDADYGKHKLTIKSMDNTDDSSGANHPNRLPYECYPWNCNPWYAVHPNSPYNSVGAAMKGRGPHHGSGLPPGASYNPRDVGLDEGVIRQLNLAASAPAGVSGVIAPGLSPHGFRTGMGVHGGPAIDLTGFGGSSRPFPAYNGAAPVAPAQRPRPARPLPYSATGQGFRSQYGYRAAASEQSAVSAPAGANSPVLSNLLNLNPVKSFRSLMSYLTGGING